MDTAHPTQSSCCCSWTYILRAIVPFFSSLVLPCSPGHLPQTVGPRRRYGDSSLVKSRARASSPCTPRSAYKRSFDFVSYSALAPICDQAYFFSHQQATNTANCSLERIGHASRLTASFCSAIWSWRSFSFLLLISSFDSLCKGEFAPPYKNAMHFPMCSISEGNSFSPDWILQ